MEVKKITSCKDGLMGTSFHDLLSGQSSGLV